MPEEVVAPTEKTAEQLAIEELEGGLGIKPPADDNDKPEETPVENTDETPADKPEDAPEKQPDEKPEDTPVDFTKITGGKFKTPEEMTAHLTQYDELKNKYASLESELIELKKVATANPFEEDADLYKIHQLSKALGTKDYSLIGRLNPDVLKAMEDIDVIRLQRLMESPEYSGKEHLLNRSLLKDYPITKPADYDDLTPDEQREIDLEVEDAKLKLSRDARKFKGEMTTKWNDVKLPEKQSEEEIKKLHEEKVQGIIKEWKTPMEQVSEGLSAIKLSLPTGKTTLDLEIEIPEGMTAAKEKVLSQVVEMIFHNNWKATPEQIESIASMTRKAFIAENFEFVAGEIAKKARLLTEEQWLKLTNNPSALKTADDGEKKQQFATDEEEAIAKL